MSYQPAGGRDQTVNGSLTMRVPGWKIHVGMHYLASDCQTIATATYKWGLTTPAGSTKTYLIYGVHCTGEMLFTALENPATYSGGAAWSAVNHKRDSANVPGATLLRGITSTGGTVLDTFRDGATTGINKAAQMPLAHREELEFVLKPNEQYVFQIQTFASVVATLRLNWYEHLPLV
jgi:hypothetical protein